MTHSGPDTLRIHAPDAHTIGVRLWRTARPRGVVQLAHGMGEHPARYDRFARELQAAGLAVIASDHRGHGERAVEERTQGRLGSAGFEALVWDLAAVSVEAEHLFPDTPVVLLGHSMGSFAALLYAIEHGERLAGLILSGTTAVDMLQTSLGRTGKLEDMNAGVPDPRTPFDWLSRDAAEVDRYIADPMCGFSLDERSMQSMFDACARTAKRDVLARIPHDLPTHLVSGECDPVNHHLAWFDPLVFRLRDAGLRRVTARTYAGARHELLNETNRDAVTRDLLAWIGNVLEPAGSAT